METSIESSAGLLTSLQALAESTRLQVLDILRDGERCVCRLKERLNVDQPLLSHHLKVLREAGLVSGRREGRWVYYSLVPAALEEVERALARLREDAAGAGPSFDRC